MNKIYFGPYVVCKPHEKEEDKAIAGCSKCGTSDYHNAFCGRCGAAISEYKRKVKIVSPDYFSVEPRIDGRLFAVRSDTGSHIYLPNRNWMTVVRDTFFYREGEGRVQAITPSMVVSETAEFSTFFAQDLKVLEEEYGTYEVCWGVVEEE